VDYHHEDNELIFYNNKFQVIKEYIGVDLNLPFKIYLRNNQH